MPRAHWRQDDPDTMDVGDVYGGGSPTGIVSYEPKLPLQVFTSDGVEIAQFGTERRVYVPLAKTPQRLSPRELEL